MQQMDRELKEAPIKRNKISTSISGRTELGACVHMPNCLWSVKK